MRHVPGGEAEEILPRRYVVDSKTEDGGLASVVSVRSTVPREVKVEISVAQAVGFAIRASVPYFLRLRQKRSYEVYNGEKIPINENA